MSRVDWRGVAMALQQLKDIAGPSEFEQTMMEHELSEKSKDRDRMFEMQQDLLKESQDAYEKSLEDQQAKQEEVAKISSEGGKLIQIHKSSEGGPEAVKKIIYDDPIEALKAERALIEKNLEKSLMITAQNVEHENNIRFGSELVKSEGRAMRLKFGDFGDITQEEYDEKMKYDWDSNKDKVVSDAEMQRGLNDVMSMMEEQGMNTAGIREGFLGQYEGPTDRAKTIIDYQAKANSAITAAAKAGKEYKVANGSMSLSEDDAFNLIEQYYNMSESMFSNSPGFSNMPEKDKDKYITKMSEIYEKLSSADYDQYLTPIYGGEQESKGLGGTLPKPKAFSSDLSQEWEKEGFTKEGYYALINNNVQVLAKYGAPGSTQAKRKINDYKRELEWMHQNWKQYNKTSGKNKSSGNQKRFDDAKALLNMLVGRGALSPYSQDNKLGYR